VTFSSPAEDARRRDFTINGLFLDPSTGEVTDYVGGRADLEARVLRAIGDPAARFREDSLRLLRAVRIAAALGFEIEAATWEAVRELAPRVRGIAAERVRDELVRILTHPSRVGGFDLLVESGLMAEVWPEVLALRGCEQPPQWHPEGDVFTHTRIMLRMLPAEASLPLVLSVLFHDIAKPATSRYDEAAGRVRFDGHDKLGAEMTRAILARHRFPNDTVEATVEAVANHMVFKDVQRMRPAKLRRFMARPTFADELELHRVDCASSNGLMDNVEFLEERAAAFATEPVIPPPLITGHDLIALGHRPGPRFGEILTDIQTHQLENTLTSREEALEYLKTHYPPTPADPR
jgi:poly(A) polymerase